jgi:hypothetical protein
MSKRVSSPSTDGVLKSAHEVMVAQQEARIEFNSAIIMIHSNDRIQNRLRTVSTLAQTHLFANGSEHEGYSLSRMQKECA